MYVIYRGTVRNRLPPPIPSLRSILGKLGARSKAPPRGMNTSSKQIIIVCIFLKFINSGQQLNVNRYRPDYGDVTSPTTPALAKPRPRRLSKFDTTLPPPPIHTMDTPRSDNDTEVSGLFSAFHSSTESGLTMPMGRVQWGKTSRTSQKRYSIVTKVPMVSEGDWRTIVDSSSNELIKVRHYKPASADSLQHLGSAVTLPVVYAQSEAGETDM